MVWLSYRGWLLMIVPGLTTFADVDAPIVQFERFGQRTGDKYTQRQRTRLARELQPDGGLAWIFSVPSSGSAHYLLDDVIMNAGTGYLTPEDDALGSGPITRLRCDDLSYFENEVGFLGPSSQAIFEGFAVEGSSGEFTHWSFAKHPRFFDVVRWTGDGGASRSFAHALDRAPGMIMVKRTDAVGAWAVYHNQAATAPEDVYLVLGTNAAAVDDAGFWDDTAPSDEFFTVGSALNASGAEYVAFIFADDDRGNGCIRTGSYTGTGSGGVPLQFIGWYPSWILVKSTTAAESWRIYDLTRPRNGFDTNEMDEGAIVDDTITHTVTTTRVIANQIGWETDSTFGDEGMNTLDEDYVWLAIRSNPLGFSV